MSEHDGPTGHWTHPQRQPQELPRREALEREVLRLEAILITTGAGYRCRFCARVHGITRIGYLLGPNHKVLPACNTCREAIPKPGMG